MKDLKLKALSFRKSTRRHRLLWEAARHVQALEERMLLSVNVLTYHNDTMSTGQNLLETSLNPSNVNAATFGKLFSYPVDGQVYAQPLIDTNVTIAGKGVHDVVFVATEHDSVYAFDADSAAGPNAVPLWHTSFINPAAGVSPLNPAFAGNGDIYPEVGITGTPVIDPTTNSLFVVAVTMEVDSHGNTTFYQRLHVLDISTGLDKPGAPVVITAAVAGTGASSDGTNVFFQPLWNNQRAALSLVNGVVYIAWSSHGTNGPYHGWVIGYDAHTYQQVAAWADTPNSVKAGIWMGGGRIASDAQGNLYVVTGNGDFDNTLPFGGDFGDSAVKLSPSLKVEDFFTPLNQAHLNGGDQDFGSGGILLLPDQPGPYPHEAIAEGKDGNMYLLNRDNMGGYSTSTNNVIQQLSGVVHGSFSTAAYFNEDVYYLGSSAGGGEVLKEFSLTNGLLSPQPINQTTTVFGFPGSTPSISANGTTNGIVWVIQPSATAVLRAYDATTLKELYNSSTNPGDTAGPMVKFAVPTVANGKVYVGVAGAIVVYGITGNAPPAPPTSLQADLSVAGSITLNWINTATNQTGFKVERSTDNVNFTLITPTPITTTTYTETIPTTPAGATFYYRVRATNAFGDSTPSNFVSTASQVGPNPPATGSVVAAINTGGGAVSPFGADTDFNGGRTYSYNNTIDMSAVAAGTPSSVFEDERVGNYTYTIPALTPFKTYTVRLGFVENYWGAANQRLFNVAINAVAVLTNFDIYATAGGAQKAITRDFSATADVNGNITIVFTTLKDNASVSMLEVLDTGNPATPPSPPDSLTATAVSSSQIQLAWTDSAANQSGFVVERSTDGTNFTTLPGTIPATTFTYTDSGLNASTTYTYRIRATGSPISSPSPTATATTLAASLIPIAYDAGGGAAGIYQADASYNGGHTFSTGSAIDTSGVTNPAPQSVYQTERYGNFSYNFTNLVPGATYVLRLDFAEVYWNSANSRLFNVTANNTAVLTNFDIFAAAGGEFKAVAKTANVVADNSGNISVQFITVKDNAKVSGISLTPTAPLPAAPTNLTAGMSTSTSITLNWTNVATNGTGIMVERSSGGSAFTQLPPLLAANATSYTDTGLTPNTTYTYRIRTAAASGNSAYSNTATSATLPLGALPDSAMVAHYTFEEGTGVTTADTTGNGHTASIDGEVTWATGKVGQYALNFHGQGNSVTNASVADAPDLEFSATSSFTISAWINPATLSPPTDGFFISKSRATGTWFAVGVTADNHYTFQGPNTNITAGTVTMTWHYVTVVQDGVAGTRSLYVDGQLIGTGAADDATGSGALWIGGVEGIGNSFRGQIDEVRIYNGVMPQAQIASQEQTAKPNAPINLVVTPAQATLNLTWTDQADNESNYYVQISSDGGTTYTPLATLPAGTTSYPVTTGLTPNVNYYFRVYAANGYGQSDYSNAFNGSISATTFVTGRYIFYNESAYDNVSDNNAIATDKTALLPGQTATFANYTSYTYGINGIMIDVMNLPGTPTVNDFTFKIGNSNTPSTWATAPNPSKILVTKGGGANGSDRITIYFPDYSIRWEWLQVTMKATVNTGLTTPDVFYWGNVVGDTGDSPLNTTVDNNDATLVTNNFLQNVSITDNFDVNRDGNVDSGDLNTVRHAGTTSATTVNLISVPTN